MVCGKFGVEHGRRLVEAIVQDASEYVAVVEGENGVILKVLQEMSKKLLLNLHSQILIQENIMEAIDKNPMPYKLGHYFQIAEWQFLRSQVNEHIVNRE